MSCIFLAKVHEMLYARLPDCTAKTAMRSGDVVRYVRELVILNEVSSIVLVDFQG